MKPLAVQRVRLAITWLWRRAGGLILVVVVVIAFILGFMFRGGDYNSSQSDGMDTRHTTSSTLNNTEYTCSMHPDIRMPNADDKCPICFMSLIPVAPSIDIRKTEQTQLALSPEAAALIDVQTTPVARRLITHRVNMTGAITYDETRLAYLTAYVGGRLDRMFVDYTGIKVRKGDHLAEIYSPELLVAQQELIQARQLVDRLPTEASNTTKATAEAVLESARERLRLLGYTQPQLETAESGEAVDDHITLYAPIGGVVIEKHAKPGSYVNEGDRIYSIADLSKVWVVLEAYESDLTWLRYGLDVEFTVQAYADEMFLGRIVFIDPVLDTRKRTVRVRVNVENPDGRLRPGMFVRARVDSQITDVGRLVAPKLAGKWISPMHPEVVRDEPGDCPVCGMALVPAEQFGGEPMSTTEEGLPLVVPDSAVLRTGQRGVVYVLTQQEPKLHFEGRTVELGPHGEGFFIIRSGLQEGELVVTHGNFQIDSALQIQAKPSMMNPARTDHRNPSRHPATGQGGHVHE